MKIRSSEVIAFLATAIIFVAAASYIFDIPNAINFPKMPNFSEWFQSKEESEPIKKKSTSKKKTGGTTGNTGKVIDSFNGVKIYYNGKVSNISGRHVTADGYNLGLRYQCVEFVKRYYYEYYNHKMPDSYGNAKDFINFNVGDGQMNSARNLRQFSNPSFSKPKIGDIIVFGPTPYNRFGHVAIISQVTDDKIEIAQQNPGSKNPSRQWFPYTNNGGSYDIVHQYVTGRLRKS